MVQVTSDSVYIYGYCPMPYLQDLVLWPLIDLACEAAVGQGVLDDVLVRFGTGLLVQLWS